MDTTYNYLNELTQELEMERQEILKLKLALLKDNNATCYAELNTDRLKYQYRKYTENLRYINKLQDRERKQRRELIQLHVDAFKYLSESKTKINNAR